MMIFNKPFVTFECKILNLSLGTVKLLLFLTFLLLAQITIAEDRPLDSIAAIVNDDVIMVSEVRRTAAQLTRPKEAQASPQTLFKDVLEKLILDKVQVQRAKAIGIKIDDAAVDQAMQSIAAQNKLDLQQFRVALIKEGYDYKQFRESIRDRLHIESLRKRQQSQNKRISENEIDDLIQAESFSLNKDVQYNIIDITVPNTNGHSVTQFNDNLNRAQQLRKRLLGKSELSQAEISKNGATSKDLGWQNAQSLNPVYLRSLSLIGEGELTDVVRDAKGFHILKLVEQRGGKRKQSQQARVRHILISADTPKAKLKVIQLRNKILAGENFSKLAEQHSADKGSASNGGELPMANPANYVPPFAQAVNTLPLNSLSQPIKTKFGWHILEVLERKSSDNTREAIKLQAQSLISEKKQKEQFKNWLQGLRDDAFVEYRIK